MTLFEQVVAYENLSRAFDKVEGNNGCAGFDGQSVEDFALNLEANLLSIRSRVLANQFRPAPLLRVYHDKEDGGKRPLSIPTVGDRVLHTAIALIITPILDPEFADFSYAYREGRSVDQAVRRILALRDAGYVWVVDADIHRYFDEIPHRKMLAALEERVADRRLLGLIRRCLKVDVFHAGSFFALKKGVAQGSPMSPVLANLYLDRLDETFERGEAKLVRFADDFVILCKSRPHAEAALELTEEALSDLRLRFNQAETRITHFKEGFRFLGVHFLRSLAFRPVYPEESTVSSEAESETEPDPFAEPDWRGQPAATTMEAAFREVLPEKQLRAIRAAAKTTRLPPEAAAEKSPEAGSPAKDNEQDQHGGPEPTFGGDPILRTLYLVTQGSELCREDERFVIRKDGRQLSEVPALKVDQIMVLGNVGITTPAMQFCLRQDIPVFLLSLRGRYYGVISSMANQQVQLHRDQFLRQADPEFSLAVSREIVAGKIANCRTVLLRMARKRKNPKVLDQAAASMKSALDKVPQAESVDQMRGLEGAAAAAYFQAFTNLLDPEWKFAGRKRRPPPDPINSLLSYGYTVLFHNVYALVRSRGLHPYVGFYHSLRQGHAALVSDLVEEFRAPIVDSTVFSMVNRGQVAPSGFRFSEPEGLPCLLDRGTLRVATRAFETTLNRPVSHPDNPGKTDYRRAVLLQVDRLAAAIRDGRPTYKAFLIR